MNKSLLVSRIQKLAKKKGALILSHYYQRPEIQEVAHFTGDSLDLSRKAAQSSAEIIVFAGVFFMAETAKILAPYKKILLPRLDAGCSLADNCHPQEVKQYLNSHPEYVVVSYVNSSAEIKALSDYVCTSSNALRTIENIPIGQPILFLPDKNLGNYLKRVSGRDIRLWHGSCVVHEAFSMEKIIQIFKKHPNAKLVAHPECDDDLLKCAHFIGSTRQMIEFMQNDQNQTFIVGTEVGMLHNLQINISDKRLIPAPVRTEASCNCSECAYMKLNTLETLLSCLERESPEITLNEEVAMKAKLVLDRMLLN